MNENSILLDFVRLAREEVGIPPELGLELHEPPVEKVRRHNELIGSHRRPGIEGLEEVIQVDSRLREGRPGFAPPREEPEPAQFSLEV